MGGVEAPEVSAGPAPRACRNCGTPLEGRFCSACGQEDRPLDLSLRDLVADVWETFTNVEGRALQTLGRLVTAPGFLTLEYFEGRRVRWVSPVRLYLIVSVVYFGLTSLTGWGNLDFDIDVRADSDLATQEELRNLGYENQSDLDAAAMGAVRVWIPRAMFVLVPLFAGLVAVARSEAGRAYPQHLVFSLHVHAALFAVFTLAAVATGLVGGETVDGVVSGISLGFALTYLVLAMRAVYGGSLRRNVLLGGVVGVTYWLLAVAVTIAILLPVVLRPGR